MIDEATSTPTSVRSVLGSYYRYVNASGTTEHLPRSLKPHPRNPERAMTGSGKWDVLFFYAGNAIKALQSAYKLDQEYGRVPAAKTDEKLAAHQRVKDAVALLEARTALLEKLALVGPSEWVLRGTDGEGHYIVTTTEHHAMMTKAVQVQADVAAGQSELPGAEEEDQETEKE